MKTSVLVIGLGRFGSAAAGAAGAAAAGGGADAPGAAGAAVSVALGWAVVGGGVAPFFASGAAAAFFPGACAKENEVATTQTVNAAASRQKRESFRMEIESLTDTEGRTELLCAYQLTIKFSRDQTAFARRSGCRGPGRFEPAPSTHSRGQWVRAGRVFLVAAC